MLQVAEIPFGGRTDEDDIPTSSSIASCMFRHENEKRGISSATVGLD
jgi:hypothetical protein